MALAGAPAGASVTFVSYGTALPRGERLVTDFSGVVPRLRTALGGPTDSMLFLGSRKDYSAAPSFSATVADSAPYLSLTRGKSATFTLAPTHVVSLYVGSLDAYNFVSFGGPGGVAYTGAQLGAISGSDNGDWNAPDTNGRFVFTFAAPVDSVTLSSTWWSFEVADIASGAPEPAGWTLMLAGLGCLGAAIRRRRARGATSGPPGPTRPCPARGLP